MKIEVYRNESNHGDKVAAWTGAISLGLAAVTAIKLFISVAMLGADSIMLTKSTVVLVGMTALFIIIGVSCLFRVQNAKHLDDILNTVSAPLIKNERGEMDEEYLKKVLSIQRQHNRAVAETDSK